MRDMHQALGRAELAEQIRTREAVAAALGSIETTGRADSALMEAVKRLKAVTRIREGDALWAMAEALRALDMGIAWEPAVETAEGDALRYRDAARLIASKALAAERAAPWPSTLLDALEILAHLKEFQGVRDAAASLRCTPLLFATTSLLIPPRPVKPPSRPRRKPPEMTVLLRFTLDGGPVSWPMALQAGRLYRLGVSVVAERWPRGVEQAEISWDGAVSQSVIEHQPIIVTREGGRGEADLIARAEIPPEHAVDLVPVATLFGPGAQRHRAQVVGQRVLRVTTFVSATLGSGQPMVAQHIIDLLHELDARIPSLPREDRLNVLHLLDATTRFAAIASDRKSLRGIDEAGFQHELRDAFILDPLIGRRIVEASTAGGGVTDLMLGRVVNELKVTRRSINLDSAERFINQGTQYASARDCPVSVLTILDDSPKTDPPGVQSNYMRWAYPKLHGQETLLPSMVAVLIIPIGFPVPSMWSR